VHRRAFLAGLPAALTVGGCRSRREKTIGKAAALVAAAHAQTRHWVTYDAHYTPLAYPEGDVPLNRGVCADVIIRAYRGIGIDLQKLVHEDMSANFDIYPKLWGLKGPDSNIDHRRVPNLRVFFSRFCHSLPLTRNPADYRPGDILTTRPITRPHIAIVSDTRAWFGAGNLMVIQNKGFSTRQDNELLSYEITGHYRYGI
jgi:uncharacterized protein YijF (DUF1287 family)